jgi:hypothetical protein
MIVYTSCREQLATKKEIKKFLTKANGSARINELSLMWQEQNKVP